MKGKLSLTASGLEGEGDGVLHHCAGFGDSILRGLGQVMFQNNSYAGLLFLAGIAVNSLLLALAALVGTATATLTASIWGVDRGQIRSGMYGFNGALVAIALTYFLESGARTWVCVLLGSVGSTVLMAAMVAAFDHWKLPALTAPFVFTALAFLLPISRFGGLKPAIVLPAAGFPMGPVVQGVATVQTVGEGLLNGIAQVFFQENPLTGVLFAAGLLVASRVAFVAALLGSLAGVLTAWGMGAAEPAVRSGGFGFNSTLTAIALASVFLVPGTASYAFALLGAVVAPFLTAACSAALEPLGMPAMTLPFVLTTWVFLFASRRFSRITAA